MIEFSLWVPQILLKIGRMYFENSKLFLFLHSYHQK